MLFPEHSTSCDFPSGIVYLNELIPGSFPAAGLFSDPIESKVFTQILDRFLR